MSGTESPLGAAYRRLYEWCCGKHPSVRPWHFQWSATRALYRRLRELLPALEGHVLDVGCADAPYRPWLRRAARYTGLDVVSGAGVDVVVAPDAPWPIQSEEFDAVVCTQVFEFVGDVALMLREIDRVLKPGGTLVLTFPFLYHEHRGPFDLQRFTVHRARKMFPAYDMEVEGQGAFGTTIATLSLAWIELSLNRTRTTRIAKALLLPLWIPFCFLVNMLGSALDLADTTGSFYGNVLLLARKK